MASNSFVKNIIGKNPPIGAIRTEYSGEDIGGAASKWNHQRVLKYELIGSSFMWRQHPHPEDHPGCITHRSSSCEMLNYFSPPVLYNLWSQIHFPCPLTKHLLVITNFVMLIMLIKNLFLVCHKSTFHQEVPLTIENPFSWHPN